MTAGSPAASRGTALAWLGHPVTLLALVLLLLNDHVFKAVHPGWWTGKLSDAAGLVLATPLVAFVFARRSPRLPMLVVGVGFILVKSNGYGAAAASAAWSLLRPSSVVLADPTDLLTLPALGVAWLAWRSAARTVTPGRLVRAVRIAVVLPLALLAVAATSAPEYPSAVVAGVDGERLVAGLRDLYHPGGPIDWTVSPDGGTTWDLASETDRRRFEANLRPADTRRACAGAECYRVGSTHLRVDRSADGGRTWSTDWQLTDRQRAGMVRSYEGVQDVRRDLSSVSVAVRQLPDGRHTVLVANGRDGFALRRPDGRWDRIGYAGIATYAKPIADPTAYAADRRWDAALGVLLAFALGFATVGVGCAGAVHRLRLSAALHLMTAVPWLAVGFLMLAFAGPVDSPLALGYWALAVLSVLVAMVVTITYLFTSTARVRPPPRWFVRLIRAGLLSLAMVAGVVALWLGNALSGAPLVSLLTLAAAAPGSALAWHTGRLIRPGAAVVPPPYPQLPCPQVRR